MKKSYYLLIALLLIAFPLAACQPEPTPTPVPTPTQMPTSTPTELSPTAAPEPTGEPVADLEVGQAAPDFSLEDLEGNQRQLSEFQGKYVMLNFWASWCPPCQAEIPHMVKLYSEGDLTDEFEIVAVNLSENPDNVATFAQEADMGFPILLDSQGQVASQYQIRNIPTSYFLNKDGTIDSIHVGTLTEDILQQYVNELMAQ